MGRDNDTAARDDAEPSPFAGLPRYVGGPEVVPVYVCGGCEVPSQSTRSYSLPTAVFFGVGILWRDDCVLKCPRCMRGHILARLPLAVLLANVLSPLVIVWWLVVFVRTFFVRPGKA
jgi:hypothetical protein